MHTIRPRPVCYKTTTSKVYTVSVTVAVSKVSKVSVTVAIFSKITFDDDKMTIYNIYIYLYNL